MTSFSTERMTETGATETGATANAPLRITHDKTPVSPVMAGLIAQALATTPPGGAPDNTPANPAPVIMGPPSGKVASGKAASKKPAKTAVDFTDTSRGGLTDAQWRLLKMLTYRRPAGSETEARFIAGFIEPLGAKADGFGNYWLHIPDADGAASDVLFSCHTDTVHSTEGGQRVSYGDGIIDLTDGKVGQCLGADCGTGAWVMCELIRAGKPGSYVFHREEETGGVGSRWVADKNPAALSGFRFCIALDRKGAEDIITHQGGKRTASDAFAASFAALMAPHGLKMAKSTGGTFTDSSSYQRIIPECTNIAVGYKNQHGPTETQNMHHATALLAALWAADLSKLVCERDPAKVEYLSYGGGGYGNYGGYGSYGGSGGYSYGPYEKYGTRGLWAAETLVSYVRNNPGVIADYLAEMGVSAENMKSFCVQRNAEYEIYAEAEQEAKRQKKADAAAQRALDKAERDKVFGTKTGPAAQSAQAKRATELPSDLWIPNGNGEFERYNPDNYMDEVLGKDGRIRMYDAAGTFRGLRKPEKGPETQTRQANNVVSITPESEARRERQAAQEALNTTPGPYHDENRAWLRQNGLNSNFID